MGIEHVIVFLAGVVVGAVALAIYLAHYVVVPTLKNDSLRIKEQVNAVKTNVDSQETTRV